MADRISPDSLHSLLTRKNPFALIDVREAGEYNSTHIPGSSNIPRRQIEFLMTRAVPYPGAEMVICDDDGRRASLAADTIEKMGYNRVCVLEGGLNHWFIRGYPTEWGTNIPSKDFGEKVEVVHHLPVMDAAELHRLMKGGDQLLVLDARTPQEHQSFCIPGGQSLPAGEMALRITDIRKEVGPDATIVVHCAGRTRSIIGARTLQRMGIENVYALSNGTAGWMLAGYPLERGSHRLELPQPTPDGLASAEEYATLMAQEDGVGLLDVPALLPMMERLQKETIYLIDVRTQEEYRHDHIPDFRWFPGGQAVQRSDEVAVVHNCPMVFCCDRRARAIVTASWYRQMGFEEVYAVEGGTTQWEASGRKLERTNAGTKPFGLDAAKHTVKHISAQELKAREPALIIFVETSRDFAEAHVPGSYWVPRGWLEFQIESIADGYETPVVVTCWDGQQSSLAGATLKRMGYRRVEVLDGGVQAWLSAGFAVEKGLTNLMSAPMDVVTTGPNRNFADMMNYLRWEEALGEKYARTLE